MSANNIKSAEVFDNRFSYYDFMYCYHHVRNFCLTLETVIQKLNECSETLDEDMAQNTIHYIHQNIDVNLSVNFIANLVGLNHEYLSRMFKKSMGLSLKRYIINQKIEIAKILLKTTVLPITLISDRVGYGKYSHFTRSFRQIIGCTSSEYRKKALEEIH